MNMSNKALAPPQQCADLVFNLDGVDLAYGRFVALHDVHLLVRSGEKVALVGPSGAGKTTLLNRLYQLQADQTAFIHQHYALVPQLSVFHNIYAGRLDRHGFLANALNLIKPRPARLREIFPILDLLAMRDKAFVRVGELSGGQQQRVAVGRAMYRGGHIVLADEPVSSLDVHQAEAIVQLVMDTDKTVLASLHSVDLALRYADRIIGICAGRIRFDLPATEVNRDQLTDLYQTC